MSSHASVPFAERLIGNEYRIYFGTRDRRNRSHVGWVRIDLSQPERILDFSHNPVISPGQLGCFDDSGAMPSWLVRWHGVRYLYYVGWNLGVTIPFRNSIGLATSNEEGEFTRFAPGPIMDRTLAEPHFCASCCVIPGADMWRMWYLSCTGWSIEMGEPKHHYHIKYAESDDGVHWRRDGVVAIDYSSDGEYAISRPSVLRGKDCWRMWFSYRGAKYRIGYAESPDGHSWVRRDNHVVIDVSLTGWDSDMIEYPHVFDHDGQLFMLYNGNDYGRTGFGLAVLEPA